MSFKEARIKKNLTLKELAEKVNASESMMCRIEKGERRPSPELAKRLSVTLNLSTRKIWEMFYA